jgi:hypothetical protein
MSPLMVWMLGMLLRLGAAIAVMIIVFVRGLPDKEERAAAEGGNLPILGPRPGWPLSRQAVMPAGIDHGTSRPALPS